MRTAKYHDYTFLRILLFIILVILAFLAYKQFVKPPCEHTAGSNGWVTVDPTCTEAGYRYKECIECGEQFGNQTLAALGHKPEDAVKENEKPHTLTEGGSYDIVVYCSVCKVEVSRETVFVDGEHIPEIIEDKENIVEATCTEQGSYEQVLSCKGCKLELERKTVIVDALGHSESDKVKENVVEPTCTTDGSHDSVIYCTVCDVELDREKVVVNALGHTEKETIENSVDPTCTDKGSYDVVHTCTVCNEELDRVTQYVDALGHSDELDEKIENFVDSTCTAKGSYDVAKYCKTCSVELSRESFEIDIQHKFDTVESKDNVLPSTCTEQGSYDIVHSCGGCGYEFSRETIITEPTGHDYGEYQLGYDYVNKKVILYVVCNNDGETSVITEEDGLVVTRLEEDVPACHLIKYTVTYTYGDYTIEETTEFDPAPHKVVYTESIDSYGNVVNKSYDLPEPEFDEVYGEYYNVDVLPGIVLYTPTGGEPNTWNEDGFALGAYKCELCGHFYIVRIYSAKYDTRINNTVSE